MLRGLMVLSAVSMGMVAGAVATLRAADEPAGKTTDAPAAVAAAEAPATDSETLESMALKAQAVYDELLRIAQTTGPDDPKHPTPEDFYTWSVRIDGGFAGDEGHRQRMQDGLKQAEAQLAAGTGSKLDVLAWQYYVAETDVWAQRMAEHFKSIEKMQESIKNDPSLQEYLNAATQPSR